MPRLERQINLLTRVADLRETPIMFYSESETAWLNLRAEKIAEDRGWPLPIARSEACAELVRSRRERGTMAALASKDKKTVKRRHAVHLFFPASSPVRLRGELWSRSDRT